MRTSSSWCLDQTILVLRIDRDLSWKEVAQVFSAGGEVAEETALRKRFSRLKERLRKELVDG